MKNTTISSFTNPNFKAVFMGRNDLLTGKWFPIAKLSWNLQKTEYILQYLHGAENLQNLYPQQPNLVTFGSLRRIKRFAKLEESPWIDRLCVNSFPFENLEFLGINLFDPLQYAVISGGYRHGDTCDLFPEVITEQSNIYRFVFRNVGRFTIPSSNRADLNSIMVGQKVNINSTGLLLVENKIIGESPPYIKYLKQQYRDELEFTVLKVNTLAPFEYQFLCQGILTRPNTIPFSQKDLMPIV